MVVKVFAFQPYLMFPCYSINLKEQLNASRRICMRTRKGKLSSGKRGFPPPHRLLWSRETVKVWFGENIKSAQWLSKFVAPSISKLRLWLIIVHLKDHKSFLQQLRFHMKFNFVLKTWALYKFTMEKFYSRHVLTSSELDATQHQESPYTSHCRLFLLLQNEKTLLGHLQT